MWSLPALTLELDYAPAHQFLKNILSADKFEILKIHISWRNLVVLHSSLKFKKY